MDIKEIALFNQWWDEGDDIANDGPWEKDTMIQFAFAGYTAAIESYKAELLKEVGEPVLYAEFAEDGGWLGDASEYADHLEEPHALFTSDQVAAAILKATNPLEDQLAAAQEDNRKLRIALDSTKRDLIRMRCPDFFEVVRDGYEFSFDNHLVNMIGLINDYAKQK